MRLSSPSSIQWTSLVLLFRFWMARSDDNVTTCVPPSLTIPATITSHAPQIVIAHRGASAHLPEHTLPAYRLALELGADFIEPDLVATKDNQLVAIHSMDLNITTNVAELFPDRTSFSKYLNRDGYWSYNFKLDELKTLKVIQRLPAARTTVFDGLFEIPTLSELMGVIQMWNAQVNPLLVNSTNGIRSKPGIYVELKDFPWLMEDTRVDLNDLFFQHMQDNADLWDKVVFDRLCDTQKLKIHEYRLPPLVVQSFEATVLEDFTKRWQDTYIEAGMPSGTTTKPVPPTVLLVGLDICMEETFWFNVGEWRGFLKGLGPGL
jgi:glycerophosphoryl diester phosphodiesterase